MFVSKSELVAALQRNIELGKRLASETSRADHYADEVTYLRGQNASLLTHVLNETRHEPVVTKPAKPADLVGDAIRDVGGNNTDLRKRLGAFAKQEAAKGKPPAEIAAALRNWTDVDGE